MGRAPCCDKANVKRGPWSPEEDATLKSYLHAHGAAGNWIALPRKAGLRRCGKSCRLRWLNYLRPNIKHGGFTEDEDRTICELFNQMGSRWSVIASHLPGRTDNDVKNYWNTKLKKKLFSGQITLSYQNPSNTSSVNTTAINVHHQKSNHGNFVPKLEADEYSSPLFPESRTTQEHATWRSALTDHGLVTVNDQGPSLSYDQSSLFIFSPRVFMGLSDHYHEFDNNTNNPKINGHVINHVPLFSGDQPLEGSIDGAPSNLPSVDGVKSSDVCEGLYGGSGGTTLVEFGFGLPYDIVF